LQSIRGFVELLEPGLPPKKMTQYLSLIRRDTSRLVAVVNDLSLMSELENGTLVFNPGTLEIEPLLRELAQAFEAGYPDGAMILEYARSLPAIYADETLRQVLGLLHHVGRSSPRVRRCTRLSVLPHWEAHSSGWLEFSVQDDGPRIPARYREAIFEPWAGRSRGPKHLRFGRGLGLYVARHIARRMGGDLWLGNPVREAVGVRRQKPKGNVFVVRMPIAVRETGK
jgi:signal transduction histidine kinase